jgi:hypothetical protein
MIKSKELASWNSTRPNHLSQIQPFQLPNRKSGMFLGAGFPLNGEVIGRSVLLITIEPFIR